MIETYWNKYLREDLSEGESEEFYLLLKEDIDIQTELLDLVHDEALFGIVSNDLLKETDYLTDRTSNSITPLPVKKSHKVLYALISIAALLTIANIFYFIYGNNAESINKQADPREPIVKSDNKDNLNNKESPEKSVNAHKSPEKLTIEQMKLPVALAMVQYPTKNLKNIFSYYSKTLVNYGPAFSNLNLNKDQRSKLKSLFNHNSKLVMNGYMKNIKGIKYNCPLTKIVQKAHADDINKEMFVWARAHTAMTNILEKKILETLDEDQKIKYLNISEIIRKYSNENGHLYLSGSKMKLKENTLAYLNQLQPLIK
ncbi:MAG: hypothetical protein COA79_14590 [Planctomycetota bacterium]|nr:MAG: hypothetical protein COA79_14590 [Planctomycetota bacterium]